MRKTAAAILLALAPAGAANAQNMPLDQFLAKATSLESKGALALLSGDLRLLKKEMTASGGLLRQERLVAVRAGRTPAYCPPEQQGGLDAKEILAHLRSIPAAQRARMRSKDGLRSLLAKKFPCSG